MGDDLSVGMCASVRLGIATGAIESLQRLLEARTGQLLVHGQRQKIAHHGADADERVCADERHQPGHRACSRTGHQAHTRVPSVLLLTCHRNLRH